MAGIRDIEGAPVGDTITLASGGAEEALPGFREVQPKVFAGLFPVDADDYEQLRDALAKLRLNDASFSHEPETSKALGFGFRCGFLGLLHMEIVQERLEREYRLNLISTAPTVACQVVLNSGETLETGNPSMLPEPHEIEEIRELYIEAHILVPQEHVGAVITLCEARRGQQKRLQYSRNQVNLEYLLPLSRNGDGLLRQTEIGQSWVRVVRLSVVAFRGSAAGETGPTDQWGTGGCAVGYRAPVSVDVIGAGSDGADEGPDSQADV